MCVVPNEIPENSNSTVRICLTLIEAYCFETGVLQIRVQNTEALLQSVYGLQQNDDDDCDSQIEDICIFLEVRTV